MHIEAKKSRGIVKKYFEETKFDGFFYYKKI